jgi:haloalkane dehalogenase
MSTVEVDAPELPEWMARQFPFRRRAVRTDGILIHFVDEGVGPAVWLLHGNPTWSFLWRKVIPPLLKAGLRVIAPDLVGFGFSDKLAHIADHSLRAHVDWLTALWRALGTPELTLVGQDWGGPMVGGMALAEPSKINALVLANTAVLAPKRPIRTTPFHRLSRVPVLSDILFRGLGFPLPILPRVQGDPRSMGPSEIRAYAYPFEKIKDRAGPLALARMVAHKDGHPTLAVLDEVDVWMRAFRAPVGLVWGLRDPILGRSLRRHREVFPQARVVETQAGHFLQEEVPEVLAQVIAETVQAASARPATDPA